MTAFSSFMEASLSNPNFIGSRHATYSASGTRTYSRLKEALAFLDLHLQFVGIDGAFVHGESVT
jgi:hypothetical protein